METESFWDDLQAQCERLEPGVALLTPVSERAFGIESIERDRIVVQFGDSGEERPLWREQFEVFLERLAGGSVPVDDLPPSVEPYASVVTLSAEYAVEDDAITNDPEGAAAGESPYLIPAAEARTPPERVRDDALLLADHLERFGMDDPTSLDTESLTDRYVLLSDVQRGADRLRREVREPLLERLGPDQQLHGHFGSVRRTTRERRRTKDEEDVFDALDERGIPREWVLGIDRDKLDVVLAVTDLEEDEVYDVDEQVYAQKTTTDESEKYSRLEGLANRLAELEGEDGEELRDELAEIEDRLEEALSAG
ncbi:hypothetical protein CV102_09695 [Natronococcus pandeyae]|uniref:DUF2800 family protein n=1 Tax=Natronococcus pandeyae TaxID=2055836 RepID=A0A8J8Q559_9EURY|nr:hypothetical protein [Natronococcus pandeyae]TYL38778.1 hypothetical protein CV102_09695 [Natronococcus pandeyae]